MVNNFFNIIISYILLITLFFSMVGGGKLINDKFLKIYTYNIYENFIIGLLFIVLYLQIHIIFFPIDLKFLLLPLIFIVVGLKNFFVFIRNKLDYKILISLILCFPIIFNSTVYPFYDSVYDFGLYHNTYINWLNQSNMPFGLANLHDRFGYAGSSYLLGAFFNFYPFSDNGYVFTTSIFFVFLVFLLLKNINLREGNFSNIFNILILYVVFKYIFVESLGDVSPDKIFGCLLIFIFYNLINNYQKSIDNNFLYSLVTLSLLVTFTPSSWFIVIALILILYSEKNKKLFSNIKVLTFCTVICFSFAVLNFLKSGNIFFPIIFPIFQNDFTIVNSDLMYQIQAFAKGYPSGNEWIVPTLKNTFLLNKFAFIYAVLFIMFIVLTFSKLRYKIFDNKIFVKLFLLLNLCIIFWFFSAPSLRFGKIYFWIGLVLLLSFYISIIFNKFYFSKLFPFFCIIIFSYCVYSSHNNLAMNRSLLSKNEAIETFPVKKILKTISDTNINIQQFNYTNEKLSFPNYNEKLELLIYEKSFFSKIYFKR